MTTLPRVVYQLSPDIRNASEHWSIAADSARQSYQTRMSIVEQAAFITTSSSLRCLKRTTSNETTTPSSEAQEIHFSHAPAIEQASLPH